MLQNLVIILAVCFVVLGFIFLGLNNSLNSELKKLKSSIRDEFLFINSIPLENQTEITKAKIIIFKQKYKDFSNPNISYSYVSLSSLYEELTEFTKAIKLLGKE